MSGESVRQRAREQFEKWVATPEGGKVLLVAAGDSKTPMLAFAEFFAESESSLARKQEREANIKAVCYACSLGREVVNIKGDYMHKIVDSREHFPCQAAAIHERGRKVEG